MDKNKFPYFLIARYELAQFDAPLCVHVLLYTSVCASAYECDSVYLG